jgi:hypothetical protein
MCLSPHPPTPSPTSGEGEPILPLAPAWERGSGGEGQATGELLRLKPAAAAADSPPRSPPAEPG